MGKPFNLLRARLMEHCIDQDELCLILNKSKSYVSSRMMAKAPWSMAEMEMIMKSIGEPWENVSLIFPACWACEAADARSLRLVK